MILSIIKKATVIYYQLISSLIALILSHSSFAAEELASFCFERSTNVKEAESALSFLLLPNEKTFLRAKDHCFDVNTSTDRSKLLEKFLHKRYTLIAETGTGEKEDAPRDLNREHCRLELKTTKKKTVTTQIAKVGKKSKAAVETNEVTEVSVSSILLGLGIPGSLELEGRSLYLECRGGMNGVYQLTFAYSELYKSRVSSVVSVRANEAISIAQITNELNEKSKTLGLPEILYKDSQGQEVISYELQIK